MAYIEKINNSKLINRDLLYHVSLSNEMISRIKDVHVFNAEETDLSCNFLVRTKLKKRKRVE